MPAIHCLSVALPMMRDFCALLERPSDGSRRNQKKSAGDENGLRKHVWQFLLPAEDMAKYERERSITSFASAEQATIASLPPI